MKHAVTTNGTGLKAWSGDPPTASTIIQMRDVVKTYKTGAGSFTAVNRASLDIGRGEFLGIVGKSGAGKTTLLNLISGVSRLYVRQDSVFPPDNGRKNGTDGTLSIGEMNQDQLAAWRAATWGSSTSPSADAAAQSRQQHHDAAGVRGTFQPGVSQKRALELLDIVGLIDHAYKPPAHISGGQKQRVAIATRLDQQPRHHCGR